MLQKRIYLNKEIFMIRKNFLITFELKKKNEEMKNHVRKKELVEILWRLSKID